MKSDSEEEDLVTQMEEMTPVSSICGPEQCVKSARCVARGEQLGARGRNESSAAFGSLCFRQNCEREKGGSTASKGFFFHKKKTIRTVINIMLIYYCTVAQNHRLSTENLPPPSRLLHTEPPCVELFVLLNFNLTHEPSTRSKIKPIHSNGYT